MNEKINFGFSRDSSFRIIRALAQRSDAVFQAHRGYTTCEEEEVHEEINNTETISTTYKIMVTTKISSRRGRRRAREHQCVSIRCFEIIIYLRDSVLRLPPKLICEEISRNGHTFVHASDKELNTRSQVSVFCRSHVLTKHFLERFDVHI